MNYRRLQQLRFVAAAAVVLFHALGTCQAYFAGATALGIFRFGDRGVDLFFVISGFIIVTIASTRERRWDEFLRRRIARIVPLYWISTLVMFTLLIAMYGVANSPQSPIDLVKSLAFATWIDNRPPVVFLGWSLEYELAFYFLVTAALAVTTRTWPLVISVFAACVAAGVVARAMHWSSPPITFVTNPMYLEFVFGMAVAHAILRRPLPVWPCVAAAAAFAALLLQPWDGTTWRVVAAGIPSALLVWGATRLDRAAVKLSAAGELVARLGDASYSIYLVQVFVIVTFCKVLRAVAPGTPVDAAVVAVSIATIAASVVVYLVVERPIQRKFRRASK